MVVIRALAARGWALDHAWGRRLEPIIAGMDLYRPPEFPPDARLPGAPDPWAPSGAPAWRDGPPYFMTEMIEAEPAFAERLLARLWRVDGPAFRVADAIREVAGAGGPVVATGCGTSEHGAMATAAILSDAMRRAGVPGRATSVQAFEAALAPQEGGLLIAVSHEGGTWATIEAMRAARARGATTALVTVSDRSPAAELADIVVETDEQDQSWCHTVGYLSAIVAAASIGGALTRMPIEASAVRDLLSEGVSRREAAGTIAAALAQASHILVVGSGADRPAAWELALKIEEACYLPSTARELDSVLHGNLPATDESTGMVVILTDPDRRPDRWDRAQGLFLAAARVGIRTAAIVGSGLSWALPPKLTPAGRILVPEMPDLPAPVASLIGTAAPLQLLTERLARARRTNPDRLRRDDPAYREAAAAYE